MTRPPQRRVLDALQISKHGSDVIYDALVRLSDIPTESRDTRPRHSIPRP
jgi:hypothetical protein